MKNITLFSLIIALSAACTPGPSMPEATSPAIPAGTSAFVTTEAAIPASLTPPATSAPPTLTPEPYQPIAVSTWADNVLLRPNPGYLFPQLAALKKGTTLKVLGRAQGNEWLLVQAPDSRADWVFRQLVEPKEIDLPAIPQVVPSDVIVVRGRVMTPAGLPVSGIQFALVQGSGSNAPRNDAMTDETGVFYAYMPANSSGSWWLGYTAISCESNIMDADCNWTGKPAPEGLFVGLPGSAATVVQFVWE